MEGKGHLSRKLAGLTSPVADAVAMALLQDAQSGVDDPGCLRLRQVAPFPQDLLQVTAIAHLRDDAQRVLVLHSVCVRL